jgi:hypothetical protein
MAQFELEQPFTSRFKRTRLFAGNGRAFFGIWRPLDVQIDGDEESVVVQRGLEGQLDIYAGAAYGDRDLWPVIAFANGIEYVPEEVIVGRRLIIPKATHVRAALLAQAPQAEVT